MDCRSFEWQVQSHLDGKLSPPEQQDLLKHAESCASCAALLQDMEALNALLSEELTLVDPPSGFVDGVMASLPSAGQGTLVQLQPKKRKAWLRNGGLVAAAALLLAVGATQLWPVDEIGEKPQLPGSGQVAQIEPQADPAADDPIRTLPTADDPLAVDLTDPENPNDADPALTEGENDGTEPATETPQQPVVAANPPYQSQSGSLDFPAPAYSSPQQVGQFLIALLAAHDDCDALLPTVNAEQQVVYYTYYNGKYYQWTQSLDVEASAEYVSEATSVPSLYTITGSEDASAVLGYRALTAISPDQRWQVTNQGGADPGTFLVRRVTSINEEGTLPLTPERDELAGDVVRIGDGGGDILCWTTDSNKFLFTDSSGKLYAYYIAEQRAEVVFEGSVSSACWLGDNRTVLLAGTPTGGTYSNIYTVNMP